MQASSESRQAVVCLTVDNLGEAADLGSGVWPQDAPLGEHFTVNVAERLLGLLQRSRLSATFFIEAFNATIYPGLLAEIASEGHEIACHAWQHEQWSALSPMQERELLTRSTAALRELKLDVVGFRPPGGQVTAHTPAILSELGYRYHSPAGSRPGIAEGLAVIPFNWQLVDAFFYAPSFAGLRARHRAAAEPEGSKALREAFVEALRSAAAAREQVTLLFHPLLLADETALSALESVLCVIDELAGEGTVQCLTMGAFADRMLAAPELFCDPAVDEATWA